MRCTTVRVWGETFDKHVSKAPYTLMLDCYSTANPALLSMFVSVLTFRGYSTWLWC